MEAPQRAEPVAAQAVEPSGAVRTLEDKAEVLPVVAQVAACRPVAVWVAAVQEATRVEVPLAGAQQAAAVERATAQTVRVAV